MPMTRTEPEAIRGARDSAPSVFCATHVLFHIRVEGASRVLEALDPQPDVFLEKMGLHLPTTFGLS